MELKPGLKLSSTASSAEFIVVRTPPGELDLTCAGAPLTAEGARSAAASSGNDDAVFVGKRYSNEAGTLELLCTKPGDGPVALAGEPLRWKTAKALPASD